VHWGKTLAAAAVIALLYFESPFAMIGIFFGATAIYYILIAKMRIRSAIFAIAVQLFLSIFNSNVVEIIYHGLLPTIHPIFMHITSTFIFAIALIVVCYFKFDIANLTRKKATLGFSAFMIILALIFWSNQLYYMYLTHLCDGATYRSTILFNALWKLLMQSAIIYIVIMLDKLATQIEHYEFHKSYTDTLEESLDNLRMFKHGYRNMVNTLLGLCELKQIDKIEGYLRRRTNDIRHDINIGRINNRLKDNMPYLYGIVLAKAIFSASSKVRFTVEVTAKAFELKSVSEEELSRMVGNLLNNAFDAALQSDKKSVKLKIRNNEGRIKIEVINSIDALVDTAKLTKKGVSTKEGHSGYGLYEVQMIVDRANKAGVKTEFNLHSSDITFIAELIV